VRHERHYTLEEARAALPWVVQRLEAMRRARARLASGGGGEPAGAPGNGGGRRGRPVGEALLELEAGAAAFAEREIVLRDLDRGLLDFPALREGREVYLCWVDGEEDIAFWHDLDAGYAGRRPL